MLLFKPEVSQNQEAHCVTQRLNRSSSVFENLWTLGGSYVSYFSRQILLRQCRKEYSQNLHRRLINGTIISMYCSGYRVVMDLTLFAPYHKIKLKPVCRMTYKYIPELLAHCYQYYIFLSFRGSSKPNDLSLMFKNLT